MRNLKRLFQNIENGGYCTEEVVKRFLTSYSFSKTPYVYDEETKYVYCIPTDSSDPVPYINKEGKHCRFYLNQIM